MDAISLREARAKRDELMKLVERGINPLAERRRQGQEQAGKRTFAEAAQAYIAQHKGGWSVSSLGAWARSTRRDAASLAKLKIDEIAVEDVKRCVAPLWDAGCLVAARLTLKRLESVFNFARAHGWTKADNPAAWGVFQYITPKRPKGEPPRHPALEWRKLPPVIAKLRQSRSMSAKALEFIALTATRASEATEMRWSEVDMEARLWSIPSQRTKTRLPHRVALSDRAMAIMAELAEHRVGNFVFIGRRGGKPPSRTAVWTQCRQATGDEASPHGFRSSFRSWWADNGVPRDVAEASLAHVVKGVEGSYQRSDLLERRRPLMQAWSDYLDGKTADNVVPLKARAY